MDTQQGPLIGVYLFRAELAAGHPTDVALQRAKLAYLQRYRLPEEQLPIHWAGWQIHGESVAVEAPRPWWRFGAVLVGGVLTGSPTSRPSSG